MKPMWHRATRYWYRFLEIYQLSVYSFLSLWFSNRNKGMDRGDILHRFCVFYYLLYLLGWRIFVQFLESRISSYFFSPDGLTIPFGFLYSIYPCLDPVFETASKT